MLFLRRPAADSGERFAIGAEAADFDVLGRQEDAPGLIGLRRAKVPEFSERLCLGLRDSDIDPHFARAGCDVCDRPVLGRRGFLVVNFEPLGRHFQTEAGFGHWLFFGVHQRTHDHDKGEEKKGLGPSAPHVLLRFHLGNHWGYIKNSK